MNDLVNREEALSVPAVVKSELTEVEKIANHFIKSRYFKDTIQLSQAVVKIMAGKEMGMGPFAAMQNLYVTNGQIQMRAQLMAYRIKTSKEYRYKIKELNDKRCCIEFYELLDGQWSLAGTETFTDQDAKRQGTQNMGKFPRNMLFARCLSNGARFYCPGIFVGGVNVYTPEEFNLEEDDGHHVLPVTEAQTTEIKEIEAEVISPEDEAIINEMFGLIEKQGTTLEEVATMLKIKLDPDGSVSPEVARRITNLLKARASLTLPKSNHQATTANIN